MIPKRIKRIRSYTGHARFLMDCAEETTHWLARVQLEEIPSPYTYSPSVPILRHIGSDDAAALGDVVIFETSHRCYDVFRVPPYLLQFPTDEAATDWHIRFSRKTS